MAFIGKRIVESIARSIKKSREETNLNNSAPMPDTNKGNHKSNSSANYVCSEKSNIDNINVKQDKEEVSTQLPPASSSSVMEHYEFYMKVAGVTYDNRQSIIRTLKVGDTLNFVPEPYNKYDCSAVRIETSSGRQIGYVPKEKNSNIFNNLTQNRGSYSVTVSSVTGGGAYSTYGVNIKVIYKLTKSDNNDRANIESQLKEEHRRKEQQAQEERQRRERQLYEERQRKEQQLREEQQREEQKQQEKRQRIEQQIEERKKRKALQFDGITAKVGDTVISNSLGRGTITKIKDDKYNVRFNTTEKMYKYPKAFTLSLRFFDDDLQKKAEYEFEEEKVIEEEQKRLEALNKKSNRSPRSIHRSTPYYFGSYYDDYEYSRLDYSDYYTYEGGMGDDFDEYS